MTNSQISSVERKLQRDILEKNHNCAVRARQNYCFKKIEGAWPTVNFLTGVKSTACFLKYKYLQKFAPYTQGKTLKNEIAY